jgi:hypothetical protein
MLAPLRDRSILESAPADTQFDEPASNDDITAELFAEIELLKQALRHSRNAQRRSALDSAAKIIAQANQISHLQDINNKLEKRLHQLESGVAITELGQKLMALTTRNEILSASTERICLLDKALCIARTECDYLVQECEIACLEIDR